MNIFQSLFSSLEACNFKSIFWVIIFFGSSIFVHELGHFIAAKRKKLFVPRFSIGFGPRLFSKNIKGTEFCISLFPLGGYVALPQLMQIKELEGEYKMPADTPSISCTDRIIVSAMGVIFNIFFALILATVLWISGIEYPQSTMNNTIGYVVPEITLPNGEKIISPARQAGLKIGDKITAIDHIATNNLLDIMNGIALGRERDSQGPISTLTILGDGQCYDLIVHPILVEQNRRAKESLRMIGIETFQELIIKKVYKHSPAERVSLQKGDKILSINDQKVFSYSQFNDILEQNNEFQLTVERNKKPLTFPIRREKLFLTRPCLKITTEYGIFEVLPIFSDKNSIHDPYKDACSLQLLSISSQLKDKFPQWEVGDTIGKIQHQERDNIADSFFIFQNAIDRSVIITLHQQDFPISIEKAELIPAKEYPSIGIEVCGTRILSHQNPFSQIKESIDFTFRTLRSLLSPSSDIHLKNLSGPPAILDTLYTFAGCDMRLLLWFVIILNVNLAIVNLIPFPVLDGGIIALTLLEKICQRKIATRILAGTQLIFILLFVGFMIYISFFDINKILEKHDMERHYRKQQRLMIDEQLFWNSFSTSHPS
ncbi:MAG: site-2 protease family protein [Puniceicoccales bacterium]|jgi:RIP metalloprotease RseP|nr:site-2 protease family protein [Puniceicoccales bacterium]